MLGGILAASMPSRDEVLGDSGDPWMSGRWTRKRWTRSKASVDGDDILELQRGESGTGGRWSTWTPPPPRWTRRLTELSEVLDAMPETAPRLVMIPRRRASVARAAVR